SSGKFEIPDVEVLIGMLDDGVRSLNHTDDAAYGEVVASSIEEGGTDVSFGEFWSLESVALINKGKCHIIAGKPTITDEFKRADGRTVRYEIGPQSFFQVNPEQMAKLYDAAAEYADLKGGETVLDLYCGAGTIGIWLLDELRGRDEEAFERTRIIGIESVKPAVIDANRNSVINNMVNTRYFAGRAEEELPGMMGLAELWKWNEVNERVKREPEIRIGQAGSNAEHTDEIAADKVDVVILDPPRAGCDEALLSAVAAAQPDRIVYVSCDPGTLARDTKYLTANGYEFIEATPVDQFPWTSHVECVALMSKANT
ncbi:MAG: class I SAM-dependent RNA methyltransferase, partial [Mogibacterium sp.]|nr:class I SAM-dependent RNA methyltransferase [Mogibacterium sp.]